MKRLTPARVTMMMFVTVGMLVAAYVAKTLLAVDQKPKERAPTTRNIPLAVANLEPGTVITEQHIGLGPVDMADIKSETLLADRVIVGRVVKTRIPAATAFHSSQLYGPDEYPPLEVSPGMRAVSVDLSPSVKIVDGLIKPGQFVDIHLTTNGSGNDPRIQGGLTMTLFKGVKILAINRMFGSARTGQGGNTVTLELTPEQANIMILARNRAEITLTYNPEGKGSGGVSVSSADRATLDEILGLKPIPEPEPPFRAEIYHGSRRHSLKFRDGLLLDGDTPINSNPQPDRTGNDVDSSGDSTPSSDVNRDDNVPVVAPTAQRGWIATTKKC